MTKVGFLGAVAGAMLLAACSSTPEQGSNSMGNGASTQPAGPTAGSVAEFQQVVGDRVYFGTDQYSLSPEARTTLQRQASWLNQYGNFGLTIEGNADERGTREYNLALGERRANSVREFLISQGVASNRLRSVSYGKERPVCTETTESCWARNRRGVSVPQ
jgi:peptidoglycan-associated lipoprotein